MTDEVKLYALFIPVMGESEAEAKEYVDRVTAKLKSMKGFVGCSMCEVVPAFYALFETRANAQLACLDLYDDCPYAKVMKEVAWVDKKEIRPWEK